MRPPPLLRPVLRLAPAVTLLAALAASPAFALPPPPHVPDALQPWVPWVLYANPELACADRAGERRCDWPGHLALDVTAETGTFTLDVWLDRPQSVALPGDKTAWPQHVLVDGQPALVQEEGGAPTVALPGGHSTVTGRFSWPRVPEVLALPDAIGGLKLTVLGQPIDMPRRDGAGRLFLQHQGGNVEDEEDSLSIVVARRVQDGVPLRVTTRLTLRVAGRPRDVVLGRLLPVGVRPTDAKAELPVQVAIDGAVRVHARPGTHTIDIEGVVATLQDTLGVPTLDAVLFEPQETWVWVPDESLRSVEVQGLQPIDPEHTQLAKEWKGGRTFLAAPGQTLVLQQTRRGEQAPPPNHVELERSLWLDLDGQGLTARDRLAGQVHQGWRLDVGPGVVLGRVAAGRQALLITQGAAQRAGVELREGKLDLEADSRRLGAPSELAIVGWDHDVQRLEATLHLPPGWELWGASGVDKMPQTWIDSWTLFDFFFVLMLAAGTGRLLGWGWGAVALFGLVLCHGRADAPEWLWLNVLAALALVRALPDSLFRRAVRIWHGVAVLLLLLALVPFAREELRHGVYPQAARGGPGALDGAGATGRNDSGIAQQALEALAENGGLGTEKNAAIAPAAPSAGAARTESEGVRYKLAQESPQQQALEVPQEIGSPDARNLPNQFIGQAFRSNDGKKLQRLSKGDSYGGWQRRKLQQVDPHAVVQTGPGVPRWQWSSWKLGFSGPVRKDHVVTLYLLSPGVGLVLAVLRVLLVALLGLRLLDLAGVRSVVRRFQDGAGPRAGMSAAVLAAAVQVAATLVVATLVVAGAPGFAWAQPVFPPRELLDDLADRLEAAQACNGPCLQCSAATLRIDGRAVTLEAEVHAQRDAAWSLPGPHDPLAWIDIALDGQPTRQLRREQGGLLTVRVPRGRHLISARGVLVDRPVVTVQLDAAGLPHQVVFRSADWGVDGLDPQGVPQNSLQLTRKSVDLARAATQGDADAGAAQDLPPFWRVERSLELGLPWQAHTRVVREGPADRPQLLKVPLLAGEAVITDGIHVEPGEGPLAGQRVAVVHLGRGVPTAEFDSELPLGSDVTLLAASGAAWTETWSLACSPIWRCEPAGLVPVHTRDPHDATLRPLYKPWPGERLAVHVVRPEGAPGQAVTIDRAAYRVVPGQRLLQATLDLDVRTSQGGRQRLVLPVGAEVQRIVVGGQPRALRPDGRKLALPLEPGGQSIRIEWQQPWERAAAERAPPLDLGGPAANVHVSIELGDERWLLWARGPDWGPAVLFWSHLALLALAALLLGRLRGLPLRTHHWLLLALGMSQVPAVAAAVVVGWFAALAARARWGTREPPIHPFWFDVGQLALVGLTLGFAGVLWGAIHENLLVDVDMQVRGNGSTATALNWYVDRTTGPLPEPTVVSLPLWVWRVAMLLWALWLVGALLRWLPWAWRAFGAGGLWRPWTVAVSGVSARPVVQPAAAAADAKDDAMA
ncbi:MAG: hypothetical protein EXR79_14535 [Myxococcales bacterium]|nr:hypothetical protein [Myxococcales bacterium]